MDGLVAPLRSGPRFTGSSAGTHIITMSMPRFQRMSQEQETVLGHNCALDIYSEPEATRKVLPCSTHRAAAAIRALHLLCEPVRLWAAAGSAPLLAPSARRPSPWRC